MIIPEHARGDGVRLLSAMLDIVSPTDDQRRFIGTLNKALGGKSNNEKWREATFGERKK